MGNIKHQSKTSSSPLRSGADAFTNYRLISGLKVNSVMTGRLLFDAMMPCEHQTCDATACLPQMTGSERHAEICLYRRPEKSPEADSENPYLHVGNDGGETEPQTFEKTSKWWAFIPTFLYFFLEERLQKQRVMCVTQGALCTTNRGTQSVYFEYKLNNNYRLWCPVAGFRIWNRHSKHSIDFVIYLLYCGHF